MANEIKTLEDLFNFKKPDSDLSAQTESVLQPQVETTLLEDVSRKLNERQLVDPLAVSTYNDARKNTAVQEAAMRFLKSRKGMSNIKSYDALDEVIEHFRSFNVNEMTAAGDFNYVSAAASDATKRKDEKAQQRLADYRLLYQVYSQLPSFFDEGGAPNAFDDYLQGLLTAPSTYVGLLLPGVGKGGGVAATQAAKAGVNATLRTSLKAPFTSRMIQAAVSNPIPTTIATEAVAGSLQNIAAQKTEIAADLRDEYNVGETAVTAVLSGALPAAALLGSAKGKFSTYIERNVGDLLGDAQKAMLEKNEKALGEADKILKSKSGIAEDVTEVLSPLDPEFVSAGEAVRRDKIMAEIQDKYLKGSGLDKQMINLGDIIEETPELAVILDPSLKKRVLAATVEVLAEGGGRREGERVTEAVARVIRNMPEEEVSTKFMTELLNKYNLSSDDFANVFMADLSEAGRTLGQASAIRKVLDAAHSDFFGISKEQKAKLSDAYEALGRGNIRGYLEVSDQLTKELDETTGRRIIDGLKGLDQARLAFMTSQTATTVRNTMSGVARVGIDTVTKAIDRGISKAVGKGVSTPNEDVTAILFGLINKKEAVAIEEIFSSGFANKATQLFRELRDLNLPEGETGKHATVQRIGAELNALNTLSDNMFKRAALVGNLKRQLNEQFSKGLREGRLTEADAADYNLVNILRNGDFKTKFSGETGDQMINKAIDEALYFTYQRTPDNPTARAIIRGIHNAPFLATSLVPFPRFIANAMRFTYEYSPVYLLDAGWLRRTSKNVDNYEELSKGLVGTGLLMGATAYRYYGYGGENWYEGRMPDGSTFDLRPFFPAAPFLWLGDMIARGLDDRPVFGDANEVAAAMQAISGTQFKAGFGLYVIDQAFEDLIREDDPAKFQRIAVNMVSNIINTYSIPLTFTQDVYNTFWSDDDERIVKDKNIDNMLMLGISKSIARLPGNNKIEDMIADTLGVPQLEIYQSGTREEPLRRVTPLTRQMTGALMQERKNRFEKELVDLKLSRRIVHSKTGVPQADLIINELMGSYVSDYLVPTIQNSSIYKDLDSEGKRDFIKEKIKDFKSDLMDIARLQSKRDGKERFGFDPMKKVAFSKQTSYVRNKALDAYHKNIGKPTGDEQYDFEILLKFAEFFKKTAPF